MSTAPWSTMLLESFSFGWGQLRLIDAYWRAANYLSVGQIYMLDNPLPREKLRAEHVKARLLGHWGTTPGLNLVYTHLNRIIRERDADVIYITGPGHGGRVSPLGWWGFGGGPTDRLSCCRVCRCRCWGGPSRSGQ